MKKIEIAVLNPEIISDCQKMAVTCARLTQRGHNVKTAQDFIDLYNKSFKPETYAAMTHLSHTTLQRFCNINVVVIGASRRFLAQITRHRTGITFMSASLQYSDYGDSADFTVPYEIIEAGDEAEKKYLATCKAAMDSYKEMTDAGVDHDACGFMAPQGLRNVLVISANPLAWKQMITQRACSRNSKETQYVMLRIWEELYKLDPVLFASEVTGAGCQQKGCCEGRMACGHPFVKGMSPSEILDAKFPLLRGDGNEG